VREAEKERMIMEQTNKLYVGNLSYDTTEEELKDFLSQKGVEAKTVTLIIDRYTGRSKGFGFVEVESEDVLKQAVELLNGQELSGRKLTVNKAKPPAERTGGRFGERDRGRSGGGYRDRRGPRY